MKLITPAILASSMLCMVSTSYGIESTASGGDFNNGATTWVGGVVPGSADTAIIRAGVVTLEADTAQGSIAGLNLTRPTGDFIFSSGSSLTVTGLFRISEGDVIINSGATLTHTGAGLVYVGGIANGYNAPSIFSIDGGTFTTPNQLNLGAGSTNSQTESMILSNGGTVSVSSLGFGGSNGTNNLSVSILSGSDLTVGTVGAGGSYASASILVDGGDFTLTTPNESDSLGNPSANFAVQYESGSIVWSGVANTTEFSAFKDGSYTTWVNGGAITSSLYTNAELYDGLIFVAGTGAVLVLPSTGVTYTSTTSGDFNTASTWGGAGVPGVIDSAVIREHDVTVSGAQGSIDGLQTTRVTSHFIMNSGSSLTVTGLFRISEGDVIINSGATLTHAGAGLVYVGGITNGFNAPSIFSIDGGTFTTPNQLNLGAGATSNQTESMILSNGGTVSVSSLSFGGSDATNNLSVSILSGSELTTGYVGAGGSYASASILVDGGDFILTTPDESDSLGTPSANFAVQFDGGSIVWKGVDSQADYGAFAATFNGWVDAGKFTSSTLSNQELKDALFFDGSDACLEYSDLPTTTLHVALGGDDSSSGQAIDAPLASLAGARNRIRALRAGGALGPVEVLVRGGVYYESPTLILEEQDSGTRSRPVVFKAYPGEKPVISGGRPIPSPSLSGSQYSVTVPGASGGQWPFRQLFIDDVRYTLARSPNQGYYFVQGIPPEPPSPYYNEPNWSGNNFIFKPGDLKDWSTLALNEISIRVYHLWETNTVYLTSVDESNHTAFSDTGVFRGFTPSAVNSPGGISKRYVVENAPDSLDAPGEWYLNRSTGLLTINPFASEDLSEKTLVAPVTQQAIIINGDADANRFVEHIRFEGIAFKHYATKPLGAGRGQGWRYIQAAKGAGYCIDIKGARFIEFIRCELSHIGLHGIGFGRGCTSNVVEQCHIFDLGGGGIYLGELIATYQGYDPGTYGQTSHNTIYNNYIHDGGIIHEAAAGFVIGQSHDNLVWNNEIAHFNWSGMQIGWTWDSSPTWTYNNRIEYNYIHDIGQNVLSDLGGIYLVGNNQNTIVGNNVIHDVYTWIESNGRGLYPDQEASGITFRNNLIYNTGANSLGINFCRDIIVKNNVFAMNYGKGTFHFGSNVDATIINNIFYTRYGNIYTDNNDDFDQNWIRQMNNNLYWRIGGEPITYNSDSNFAFWKFWRGWDSNSLEADPMFKDPENGDFSFANTQNADAIGFVPVDWTQSGLEGPAEWVDLPKNFERERSYRLHFEEKPGDSFNRKASETFMGVQGASVVESGGQEYGAVTYSRIKVPMDVNDLGVRASSNLQTPLNNWSSLTEVQSVVDDGVITESVTIRDNVPVSSSKSRFYRLRSQ